MKPQPLNPPKFMQIAKILTEVSAINGIDEVDAEALGELLKDELNEYCRMLDEYYIEGYHNAISRARSIAYDAGYEDGYDTGYSYGYSYGHSESHSDGNSAV